MALKTLYIFNTINITKNTLNIFNISSDFIFLLSFDPINPPSIPPAIINSNIPISTLCILPACTILANLDPCENSIIATASTAASFGFIEKNIVNMHTFIGQPPMLKKEAIVPSNIPIDIHASQFSTL